MTESSDEPLTQERVLEQLDLLPHVAPDSRQWITIGRILALQDALTYLVANTPPASDQTLEIARLVGTSVDKDGLGHQAIIRGIRRLRDELNYVDKYVRPERDRLLDELQAITRVFGVDTKDRRYTVGDALRLVEESLYPSTNESIDRAAVAAGVSHAEIADAAASLTATRLPAQQIPRDGLTEDEAEALESSEMAELRNEDPSGDST